MNPVDLIIKKRDGGQLTRKEIEWFVEAYSDDAIPDYQAAALLMAIFFSGMERSETVDLTEVMAGSGDQLDLHDLVPYVLDKHSSGGVGDKTTLVALPLVVASGHPVGKMSGRALGFTGGTLDKLESIPGWRAEISTEEFRRQLKGEGIVLCGQTADLAPADKKLYALRDVTGTVNSLPLIAASIMSKKLAAGADGIVLDVKVGSGAFMKTVEDAVQLARLMVDVAKDAGRSAVALISGMNQPLGVAVGNALEVKEAIATLNGHGPKDFTEHSLVVAAHMVSLARSESFSNELVKEMSERLSDGSAWQVFRSMVAAQGGSLDHIDNPDLLPDSNISGAVSATEEGYLKRMDALTVGVCSMELGAGRKSKADPIDYGVGIEVLAKVGDKIQEGQELLHIHANSKDSLDQAMNELESAIQISDQPVPELDLFYQVVE